MRDARAAVEEIGRFFHDEWHSAESFEGWQGLPQKPKQQPSLEEANEFFLGCCIDYMTKTRVAWGNARRFCHEIVSRDQREGMWK